MRWRSAAVAMVLLVACGTPPPSEITQRSTSSTATVPATTPTIAGATISVAPETTTTSGQPSSTIGRGSTTTSGGRYTAAGCPPTPPRHGPDPSRPRYRLDVDVRLAENAVVGTQTVRFTPDIPTDRLVLRLWPNGPRSARAGARLDIGTSRVDGATVPAAVTDPTTLVLRPPGGVDARQTVEVSVDWRLRLPGTSNDRLSRTGESVRLGSFFPILSWEPGSGWATEPATSGFAESSSAPTADFEVNLKGLAPGLTALASGVYDRPGHWTATAVRDFALSIGRFRIAGATVAAPHAVQVNVAVAAGLNDDPAAYLAKIRRALPDFAYRFGAYPGDTFTLAITPGLSGGIEYPTHVMQGPGTVGRTTSHEIGHMWFYGLVGNNQGRDPWLDEGLATWAEARFEGTLGSMKSRTIPADAKGRTGAPMTYWESHQSSYYRGVYVQGTQALAALGAPDRVDCALAHYVAAAANTVSRNRTIIDALRPSFANVEEVMARYGVRA